MLYFDPLVYLGSGRNIPAIRVFPKIWEKNPNHPILIGFSIINHPFWGGLPPLFLVQHLPGGCAKTPEQEPTAMQCRRCGRLDFDMEPGDMEPWQ